ncbi:PPOX class F420-dependent enzyme [Thermopolyspora flexuosa]|uniref:PPOX class probable F420-dependent enzyme n=2 Tax=Thermopolyspora flexuosa TaxID=103836 RepID=A0A543IZC9_9ACTN|nr:PPOX class probable F420-dependent enzyme [Thermopolyspora flexuosa]GGM63282.1 PPOX class F420-dependent enzyme [Thermopolyspora flexuosa]
MGAGRGGPPAASVYAVEPMTDREWRDFVLTGTRTGKLAVTRADGSPHVTPVWFLLDGDDVVFQTGESSVKGRHLHRDPRAALCVDDQSPPYSFVLLEGTTTLSADLDDLRAWASRIAARYMGRERAAEYGMRNAVPGELLVRLHVERVHAYRGVAE